ncbi:MAG TPA: transglutaminase domain-containing protein [Thermoanaerobaculia bacterium]
MAYAWDDPDLPFPPGLDSPAAIQELLDDLPYSVDPVYRCPASVLRDRKAHCYDGAIFAAAALRRLGFPPRIVEMLPEPGRDDDHLLAVFTLDGRWGAVGKSNYVGLRFREPVYRDLRELMMSYFEAYYNVDGEKTLRGYTVPLSLKPFDRLRWTTRDEALDAIAERLDQLRRVSILTPPMAARLSRLDRRSYEAGLMGALQEGLYKLQ